MDVQLVFASLMVVKQYMSIEASSDHIKVKKELIVIDTVSDIAGFPLRIWIGRVAPSKIFTIWISAIIVFAQAGIWIIFRCISVLVR